MTTGSVVDRNWHLNQVNKFLKVRPKYETLTKILALVLEDISKQAAPFAVVQVRAKKTDSFAEKAVRKAAKYTDPVNQLTDLCGGRVITHTQAQVDRVSALILEKFFIFEKEDVGSRLKTGEFGYLSHHYIVQLNPQTNYGPKVAALLKENGLSIADLSPLKAEVQVRTLLQHAWADMIHDRLYKNEFKVPLQWHRISSRLAAVLEDADQAFERLTGGVDAYKSYFGAYMNKQQMADEIDLLKAILESSPDNPDIALRLAKIAHAAGDFKTIIDTLEKNERPLDNISVGVHPCLLRELGNALCRDNENDSQCAAFKRGQAYLEQAVALNPGDADTIALLAASWEPRDSDTGLVLKEKKGMARAPESALGVISP